MSDPIRARAMAKAVLDARLPDGGTDLFWSLVLDAAEAEPVGVIALLAHVAVTAIAHAALEEIDAYAPSDEAVARVFSYLWQEPRLGERDVWSEPPRSLGADS